MIISLVILNGSRTKSLNTIVIFLNRFRLYIANISWIMGEKVLQMAVGFVVTIVVARYLGPENFGILAYATSLTAIFATAGHMGLSGLIVREIVKNSTARNETLGTTVALKGSGVAVGFLVICSVAFVTEDFKSPEFWVLVIVAASLLFNPSEVFDFWFQAHVQAKYTSVARVTSLILSGCLKVALVAIGAKLFLFAFANLLQAAVAAFMLYFLYSKTSDLSIRSWFASLRKAKELIGQGWVIFLGSIFASVYLKIDQVMLKWMVGTKEVGIYSVASTISEAWYFVPAAIVASFFPRLIKLHGSNPDLFRQRLQQVFDLLFILALVVVILITLVAGPLIDLLYGAAYHASSAILVIHIWAAIFIFMRAAFSKWILIENVLVFSLITQGFGALANVGLNYLLIPKYAGLGAAIATLISYAVASYISLFFYKRSRPIFWMMTLSLISPARYAYATMRGQK